VVFHSILCASRRGWLSGRITRRCHVGERVGSSRSVDGEVLGLMTWLRVNGELIGRRIVAVIAYLAPTATMSTNLYEVLEIQADATPEQGMSLLSRHCFSSSQPYFQSEKHTRNGHFKHIPIVLQPRARLKQRRSFVR
jgi:hypothetical protein